MVGSRTITMVTRNKKKARQCLSDICWAATPAALVGARVAKGGRRVQWTMVQSRTITMVTRNKKKAERARQCLSDIGWEVDTVDIGVEEVQADTVREVAAQKARAVVQATGRRNLLITDYGLFINSLNGFPGPYTDYVSRTLGCDGVLRLLP
eukprot:gene12536-19405_t